MPITQSSSISPKRTNPDDEPKGSVIASQPKRSAPGVESAQNAPEGVGTIQMSGEERRARGSAIDRMRDVLADQPKVRVRLSEDARVQINGYTFQIKGKVSVDVPQSVADVLENAGLY